jgi:DNA-binding MarR family transcriptional regulator
MNKNLSEESVSLEHLDNFRQIIEELNRKCHERARAQCELFGVNEAELRCLRLFENQRYLTSKGIAAALGVAKSRVTKIIEGLVGKGLLQRLPDPGDSRVVLLGLTPLGQEKWATAHKHVQMVNRAILARLSEGQRVDLLATLAMLKAAMDAVSATGPVRPDPANPGPSQGC